MAGFFGTISQTSCVTDVFYGTDYHSHLGTRRAGMATFDKENGFKRSIHNISNSHFRKGGSGRARSLLFACEQRESVPRET